jgi:hypothetical protein
MNKDQRKIVKRLVLIFLACASLVAGGCEGTDTREQVDDTVEEMAGKKDLERYKQMKDNLGEIQTQQTDRYRQLDEDTK